MTERYYRASAWPTAASIAPIVDDDATTILLYNELFFRHVYAKTAVTVDDRVKSFHNYVELFNVILGLSEEPEFDLPTSWLWEMIDGFVEQFYSFHIFRSKNKAHTPAEQVAYLRWRRVCRSRVSLPLSHFLSSYRPLSSCRTSLSDRSTCGARRA